MLDTSQSEHVLPSGSSNTSSTKDVLNEFKPTSRHLKTALLSYFRYRRQCVAGDEVHCGTANETCDVLVLDKQGYAIDIEVKLSKGDLWQGEAKKKKHSVYLSASLGGPTNTANLFYICVPTLLVEDAKKWVKETNSKYGVIEFLTSEWPPYGRGWEHMVKIRKQAKMLHDKINVKWNRVLLRRLSSCVTTIYQGKFNV